MEERQDIRRLYGIRGFAVLIVVISHYSNETGILGSALGKGAGQFGVMLFFILSAFLMSILYANTPANKQNMINFVVARVARIVPLYYAIVLISFAAKNSGITEIKNVLYDIGDVSALTSHILFLVGTDGLWSIPPEVHFYLFFMLYWYIQSYCKIFSIALPLAGIAIFSVCQAKDVVVVFFNVLPIKMTLLSAYPYFCAGLLLGQLYQRFKLPKSMKFHVYVVFLACIPLFYPLIFTRITGLKHAMWADPFILFSMSLIFFVQVWLVPDNNLLLENPVSDCISKISFSVYLLHSPVLNAFKLLGLLGGWAGALAYFMAVLLASYTSYRLLELSARQYLRSKLLRNLA